MENCTQWQSISKWGMFRIERPTPNLATQFIKYREIENAPARTTETNA